MMHYADESLHCPLTRMTDGPGKQGDREDEAREMFDVVLKFMSGQSEVAPTLLQMMYNKDYLVNELYAQVIKQTNGVPTMERRERAWRLLGLLLCYVKPKGEFMEKVVHEFLLRREAFEFEDLLLARIFDAERRFKSISTAPSGVDETSSKLPKAPVLVIEDKQETVKRSTQRLRCMCSPNADS